MRQPLEGIRVLDLSRLLPGPYCSMLLSDLGAEVIKIEQPTIGDYAREVFPEIFLSVNRNKKSLALNLKTEKGKEVFYRLIDGADVVIEGFSPGVPKRLGIDYESVKKINPMLIYCSITGFGQNGPYRDLPGHDINYLGVGGALSIRGTVRSEPDKFGLPIADLSSAMFAALSIIAAIMLREKIGMGQYLDVAMTDCIVSWVSVRAGKFLVDGHIKEQQMGHLAPGNNIFTTKDGKQITVGAVEDSFWESLCKALEIETLIEDPIASDYGARIKNGNELYRILQDAISNKAADELIKRLREWGVPCGPVNTIEEAFSDPHILHRGLINEITDSVLGEIKQVSFPVKFSEGATKLKGSPPGLGEHTEEILSSIGYSKPEFQRLKRKKVV